MEKNMNRLSESRRLILRKTRPLIKILGYITLFFAVAWSILSGDSIVEGFIFVLLVQTSFAVVVAIFVTVVFVTDPDIKFNKRKKEQTGV